MEENKTLEMLEKEGIVEHEITITEVEVDVEELNDEELETVSGGATKNKTTKKKQKEIHVGPIAAELRKNAGEEYDIIRILRPGTAMWYLGEDKVDKNKRKWAKVQVGGDKGWIWKAYIL